MALIKSKQIQTLDASKVIQNPELQFTSATEKAVFNDKYTVAEIDAKVEAINSTIANDITAITSSLVQDVADLNATVTNDVSTINTAMTTADTGLQNQISTNNTNATNQMNTMNTSLQNQITNAIAGLTWKSPVTTFANIAITYPTPLEGWVVTVDDTNKIFRYDAETTTWVDFPIQMPTTYARTISVVPASTGVVSIDTGIRNDNTGIYKTGHSDIILSVNGFIQTPGSDKDYTTAFVAGDLIITWNNRSFQLDNQDELDITYTHFDVV